MHRNIHRLTSLRAPQPQAAAGAAAAVAAVSASAAAAAAAAALMFYCAYELSCTTGA